MKDKALTVIIVNMIAGSITIPLSVSTISASLGHLANALIVCVEKIPTNHARSTEIHRLGRI